MEEEPPEGSFVLVMNSALGAAYMRPSTDTKQKLMKQPNYSDKEDERKQEILL